MRGKIWRKVLAASLALLIVSGSVPIKPISNVFESMVVTAEAVEEVTKTYSLSTYVRADDGLSFSMTDPDDNTSKTVFTADGDNYTHTIRRFGSSIQVSNGLSYDDSPNVRFWVLPNVNGKVTKIEFTKACRVAGKVIVGDHDAWPPTWEDTSFFMSIDGMKYNGTDEALTGESHLDERGNTTESENFTFISTDPEGIEGNLSLWLGKSSMFTMLSGCEIKIHYIPAAEPAHEHDFTYSKNGNTLTATCGHSDGRSCSLADSNHQISVSLEAEDAYYQFGYVYPATLLNNSLFASETGATIGNITYRNNTTGQDLGTQKPTGSGENPTGAGDYTASVTINVGGTTYTLTKDYTLSNLYTINNSYPQFSFGTENYSVTNRAAENETVTLTFTPQYGETLNSLSVKGETTNYSLGNGITKVDDTHYTFLMPAEEVNISEATFGVDENDFVQDGDTYTIKNADGWNYFCLLTNYDTTLDGFNGKTIKLDKDIEVSAMAGMSNHPFKGTFDGQGKTLTFNLTASEDYSAPFHYINGATISNLHVEGTITGGTYESLGGLVGRAEGNITIENCHVSTQISTTSSGSAWHGGVIAQWNGTNATCTVTGCVYDGLIYNPDEAGVTASCRGFIGWDYGNNGTIKFTDCLSAPAAYGTGKYALGDNCCTFVYPNSEPTLTYNMTNCYYTNTLGNRQGRPAATATTAPANLGNATTDHGLVKGYKNGFLYNGNYYTPKYGDAVVDYDFDEWNERASVTFNGNGNNLVGVNITEEVGNIKSVTYNRTFTPGATTTVILPFNYECNGDEGGTFYNFKDVTYDEDQHIWVCKIIAPGEAGSNNVTSLTANTPYLFVPTATKMTFPNITNMTGGVVTLQPTTLNEYGGATTNDNLNFYGTYTGKNWTGTSDDYGFAAHGGTAAGGAEEVVAGQFVRYAPGAIIGPMRCYLRYAGNVALENTYTVANPGDPVRNVPWWDGNDGYESTEIFDTVAYINITAPTNGSITAKIGYTSASTAHYGDTVTLDVTPDTGYSVKSVKYNGTEATKNADGTYSFEMPAKDVTVTAVFGHTVAIDNNITNGTVSADLPVAENNEAVTLTVTPAAGYAVKSVKVGNTEIEPVNGVYSFTMPDNDVTVTAEFEAITYSVAFNKNSNDATGSMDNQSFTGGTAQVLTANGFTAPTGYHFAGWATSANGAVEYADGAEVSNLTAVNNDTVTLYAKWEANKHTVTYKVDGEVYGAVDTVAYGTALTAREAPTKTGYTFSGWSEIPATMPDEDVVITGSFIINKYAVTWKNGDTTLETDTNVPYGIAPSYDGATPTKAATAQYSYTFSGWSDGTNTYAPAALPTVSGNVTYTAQFNSTAKTYTITYKVDGEVYDTKTVSYGDSIALIDAPTREGYTFSGWQTSYTTMPASNIEITGTFAINTYAVTYMVDGVQYGESLTVDHGTKLTAPTAPAKNGAIFLGWTADGVNAYDFETPVTAETTLTAMWLDASGFITFSEGYAVTDNTYNGTDRDYVGFRFAVNMDNSNYTVVQHGILYGMNIAAFSDGKADANLRFTDEEATALMDKVREFAAQNTDTETTDWIEVYIGDRRDGVVYARGFIIVTDGTNNYLIYSDVQEGSYNSFSE